MPFYGAAKQLFSSGHWFLVTHAMVGQLMVNNQNNSFLVVLNLLSSSYSQIENLIQPKNNVQQKKNKKCNVETKLNFL